jgi:hypothetical protein
MYLCLSLFFLFFFYKFSIFSRVYCDYTSLYKKNGVSSCFMSFVFNGFSEVSLVFHGLIYMCENFTTNAIMFGYFLKLASRGSRSHLAYFSIGDLFSLLHL